MEVIMPKKQTESEAKTAMIAVLGPDYEISGTYINGKEPIGILHKVCGKTYFPIPKDVKAGKSRCSHCGHNLKKLGVSHLPKEIADKFIFPKNIEEVPFKKTISVQCKKCDYVFNTCLSKISLGRGCANCVNKAKFTHETFVSRFREIRFVDCDEYEFLSRYTGLTDEITVRHKCCKTVFQTQPERLLRKSKRCPGCYDISLGVKTVIYVATKLSLPYKTEVRFDDLKGRVFDFLFPTLNLILEYDGQQHFVNKNKLPRCKANFQKLLAGAIRDWEKNNFMREETEFRFIRINETHVLEETITQMFKEIIDDIAVPSIVSNHGAYLSLNGKVWNEKEYYLNQNRSYFKQLESVV